MDRDGPLTEAADGREDLLGRLRPDKRRLAFVVRLKAGEDHAAQLWQDAGRAKTQLVDNDEAWTIRARSRACWTSIVDLGRGLPTPLGQPSPGGSSLRATVLGLGLPTLTTSSATIFLFLFLIKDKNRRRGCGKCGELAQDEAWELHHRSREFSKLRGNLRQSSAHSGTTVVARIVPERHFPQPWIWRDAALPGGVTA